MGSLRAAPLRHSALWPRVAQSAGKQFGDSGNELTFPPLPLLFQNSAAFLEESKQNKCDCLKNYWKTGVLNTLIWLCWADVTIISLCSPRGRGRGTVRPEGGGAAGAAPANRAPETSVRTQHTQASSTDTSVRPRAAALRQRGRPAARLCLWDHLGFLGVLV